MVLITQTRITTVNSGGMSTPIPRSTAERKGRYLLIGMGVGVGGILYASTNIE